MLLDHGALAQVTMLHYLDGLTIGHLAKMTGLNKAPSLSPSTAWRSCWSPYSHWLLAEVRGAGVIFGDETTWCNNRDNGYAWMVRSVDTVVYFCYAHLLRDLEDLEKEFPGQAEVAAFVKTLKPKLTTAMRMRRHYTNLASFQQRARRLKVAIQEIANRPARHAGIQSYQAIFPAHSGSLARPAACSRPHRRTARPPERTGRHPLR